MFVLLVAFFFFPDEKEENRSKKKIELEIKATRCYQKRREKKKETEQKIVLFGWVDGNQSWF